MKTIDKQHSGANTSQVQNYCHIFSLKDNVFKIFIHPDASYAAQSKIYIEFWDSNHKEWKKIYRMFGATAANKYSNNIDKIEKHLIDIGTKIVFLS